MSLATFFSYVLVSTFTPGPNTIMAMTNSIRSGLRRALRFCLGAFVGFLIVTSLSAVLISALLQYVPAVTPVLQWVGAAYILFLAVHVFLDRPPKDDKKPHFKPDSFFTGIVMQFVNVKVLLCGITALSAYVLPYTQSGWVIAGAVLIICLFGLCSTCTWALFGSLLQGFLSQHRKPVNAVLALLLVGCAVMCVLPS